MELLIKVAAAAVIGSVLVLVIRKNNQELALLLTVALSILVLTLAADALSAVVDFIERLSSAADLQSGVVGIVIKTVGIAILTKISADLCRDSGQAGVASAVELTGSAAALYIALPLMETVLKMVEELV